MQTALAFYISLFFILLTIKNWDIHDRKGGLTWLHEWLHYMMSLVTNPDLSALIGKDRLKINRKASKGADNEDLVGSVENIRGNAISVTLTALAPFLTFVLVGMLLMLGKQMPESFNGIKFNLFSLVLSWRFLVTAIILFILFIVIFSRISVLSNTDFSLIFNRNNLFVLTPILVISQYSDILDYGAFADYKIQIVLMLLLIYFVLLQTILAFVGHLAFYVAVLCLSKFVYAFMIYLLLFSALFFVFSLIFNFFRRKKERDMEPEVEGTGETILDKSDDDNVNIEI